MRNILLGLLAALVVVVPAAVGAQRPQLVAIASAPDWSPDGSSIAYAQLLPGTVNPRSDLVVASLQSGGRRTLAAGAYLPRWSPDGSRIAYVGRSPDSGNVDVLYVVPVAGGAPTMVANEIGTFAWSRDGRELLYDRGALTCSAITAVSLDDLSRRRFVLNGAVPMPAPDGKRLAYLSGVDDPGCVGGYGHLSVANLNGSDARVVLRADVLRAAWSPDGNWLAADVQRADQSVDVIVVKADGSDSHLVAHGSHAAWSPDGGRIAYVSTALPGVPFPRDEPYLRIADFATVESTPRLVSASAEPWGGPVWSPDGKTVALSRALERGGVSEGVAAGLNRYVSLYRVPVARPAKARRVSLASCELVRPGCTLAGGPGGNVLTGTRRADVIWGYGGEDRITGGAGDDVLRGGSGNDVLTGGFGRDIISGGSGGDLVFARDRTVDHVYCGSGFDVVFADRFDVVARDCERVVRG